MQDGRVLTADLAKKRDGSIRARFSAAKSSERSETAAARVALLACFAVGVHTGIGMAVADRELLEEFARRRSDSAFAEIVSRYANLVYAAALRQVRDPHLAQDVTQATFIVLARRASGVSADRLPGWLILTARFCAKDALKKQARRTRHEQEAASMRPIAIEPPGASQDEIAGALDDAISRLRVRESTAVTMRYLQNRPMADVAANLGVSVDAAQKTVSRSVMKLRKILMGRGVVVPSAAALSAALLHESAQTAPAALAISAAGASAQTLSIAKGVINMMLWTKIKLAAVVTAVALTGGTGAVVLNRTLAAPPAQQSPSPQPAPPIGESSVPASQPAEFNSPFLHLIGCRIQQTLDLTLTAASSQPSAVKWYEQQYSQLQWNIDPGLAAKAIGYTISVTPADNPAGGQTTQADKDTRGQVLLDQIKDPGEYDVKVAAVGPDAKPIAEASAHVTVEPLPATTILISHIQDDGTIRFLFVTQFLNESNQEFRDSQIGDSDFVHVEKMSDDQGRPVRFTTSHQGDRVQCRLTLNDPVDPGQPVLFSCAGGITSVLVNDLGGTMRMYSMTHSPGNNEPTRRIELYFLPAGAKLVSTSPANLPQKVVDGRVQIYVDVIIPPGGSNAVSIRYRLSQ